MRFIFTKRSIVGAFLLLVLIGEPAVGSITNLFTIPGFLTFVLLYLFLFHLFESIIVKFKLVAWQLVLLTFAIYSVGVTGLLNKELTEYLLKPNPFISLIRIQASFFTIFAFYLLNQWFPRQTQPVLSVKKALILFSIFGLLVSLTGSWGVPAVIFTFKTVPNIALVFTFFAVLAVFLAFFIKSEPILIKSKKLTLFSLFLLLQGLVPSSITFTILLFGMILGGIYLLLNPKLRNMAI